MQPLTTLIEEALRTHNTEVHLFQRISENDVYHIIRQVMRDNPDIFWFSHQWRYSQGDAIVSFRYTIDEKHCEKIKSQIDDVVQKDFKLKHAQTLLSKAQVMYVYKWIALYCNYTIHSAHNQTIYSVFVHRHSVCTGIAKTAQYLLKLLGIESRLVFGKLDNSEKNSRHCWLIVNIEGQWYHLDPTFAIPETEHLLHQCGVIPEKGDDLFFYNFFCVDTETIKQSRTIEEEELLPTCNNKIDYFHLRQIKVTPSRNENSSGLGCVLSTVGATADIYLAHDKDKYNRCRLVAKVFRDDENHELLRKELIVMRECAGSPYFLRVTEADFTKGILYMEQATPFPELLASHYYKLSLKGLCNLLIDIASGLKELLNHGILYRDIHLNNIFLYEDPLFGKLTYKLGDFGSCTFVDKDDKYAGLTERGGVGSKWYMAPETWNNGIFDERSAVYGIGMIAYYLLNDLYPPFWQELGERSFEKRLQSHRLPTPNKLKEEGFCNLHMDFIFKSMNLAPANRYQTLEELINAINECKGWNQDKVVVVGTEFKTIAKQKQIEEFSSTCADNPSILVSNGENDVAYIDSDDDCKDILFNGNYEDSELAFVNHLGGISYIDISDNDANRENDVAIIDFDGDFDDILPDVNYDESELTIVVDVDGNSCADLLWADANNDDYGQVFIGTSSQINDFATTCGGSWNDCNDVCCDDAVDFAIPSCQRIDDFATTCAPRFPNSTSPYEDYIQQNKHSETYFPGRGNGLSRTSDENKMCASSSPTNEVTPLAEKVNSSIFAPSETKRGDFMMVQVFLYKDDEERAVACKAADVDPDARRQNFTPLSVKLKDGDRVKAKLMMSGKGIEVDEPIQEMVWQRHYTDCQFGVFVPEDYKPSSMMGTVMLTVNDIPCGRMMFKTKIVSQPQKLYAKIESNTFHKIFISYSHKDESTVKYFAKAFQAQGVDYFFDRHYLKAGDVYPLKIKEYINSADLFILCWSKNAAESDYVQLERQQALALAFPQKDMEQATLSIHPISIEPHADYPSDMKEVYNFEEI